MGVDWVGINKTPKHVVAGHRSLRLTCVTGQAVPGRLAGVGPVSLLFSDPADSCSTFP